MLATQLDQKTLITFDHVVLNNKMKSELFMFKTPKGVDVVKE